MHPARAAGAITDEPWSAVNSGNSEQRSQNVKQTLNTFDAIHTGNPASVFSSSIPRSSSVSSAKSSLSPSSATRSSRTDSSATNGSQSKRRCCNNRNKQSQLEAEEEYSESQDYCIYRCPVWQKARGPGKSKLPSICQTIEGTKDVIEQHSEDHHLGCPICRMDPKLQRKRSHAKDGVLTVPMTMDKMYFGEMPNFIDHIKRHLKFYFCVNCGQGCFTQQSQNEHENNCREKISGVDLSKNRQVDEAVRKMILEVDKWRAANTNSDKSFKKGKDVIGDLSKVLLFDPVYSKNGKEKRVKKFDSLDNTNSNHSP
ncbi:hypothetical protein BZA77DRAFT_356663 [Pyronema omphalodes]|nr:hypothetical protein BZA77DRAFT_356663 [Pyronema omphalodes]